MAEFKALLTTAMTTGSATTYNVSKFHMKSYEMVKAYFEVAKLETVAYNSYFGLSYSFTLDSSGYGATFKLKNIDSGFALRYTEMKNAVDQALVGISQSMTDLEKVVYIHDYLAYNVQYDMSTNVPTSSYWPYGVMVKKIGVCDSYSKAFVMLMDKLGIKSEYVLSLSMDHSWVVVKLGNYYYHLDVTWDDPAFDTLGRVNHEFMLRTDNEFINGLSKNHYDWYNGWSTSKRATDTEYTNWEIHNVKSHMFYSDEVWYYVDSTNSIVKSDILNKNKTVIVAGGSSLSEKIYTVERYNNGWLYTQGDKLMYCDYDGSNIREVLKLDVLAEAKDRVIRYLHISANNTLTLTVYNYSDVSNEDTYISKNVIVYQLDKISELIAEADKTAEIIGYTLVSYIVINLSNSIDTGYQVNNKTSISLDMALTVANNYGNILSGADSSSSRLTFRQEAVRGLYVAYGWYNSCVYKPAAIERFNITQRGAQTYINGTLVRTATTQSYQTTSTLKLGTTKCRIYTCKIWDGDQLIRDYIPVLDINGAPCLYDKVLKSLVYGTSNVGYGN